MIRLLLAIVPLLAFAQPEIGIRPDSGKRAHMTSSADGLDAGSATLLQAVAWAYDIDAALIDAPPWFGETRYDFVARGAGSQTREAFQQALVEYFRMAVVREQRYVPVWLLRWPKGGKDLVAAEPQTRSSGLVGSWGGRSALLRCGACSIEQLVWYLQRTLKTRVIDETGLGGYYTFAAEWDSGDENAMMRAFREDIGLSLTKEFRPAEVLVVISAERPAAPAQRRYTCEASEGLRNAVERLPPIDDLSRSWHARLAPRGDLIDHFGSEPLAWLPAQDAMRAHPHLAKDWDAALERYGKMSDPLLRQFLEARLFLELKPGHARTQLSDVVLRAPDFPWAHVALAELATMHPARVAELESHLRSFRELCPESLAAAHLYEHVQDPSLVSELLLSLSRTVSGRIDDEAISAYSALWHLRNRAWKPPLSSAGALRRDLSQLRMLDRASSTAWRDALRKGYRIAGDDAALKALDERVLRAQPLSDAAFRITRARWFAGHGPRDAGYADHYLEATDDWMKQWPNLPQPLLDRWNALLLSKAPAAQLSAHATILIESWQHYPDQFLDDPIPLLVGRVLTEALLLTKSRAQAEEEERYRLGSESPQIREAARGRIERIRNGFQNVNPTSAR